MRAFLLVAFLAALAVGGWLAYQRLWRSGASGACGEVAAHCRLSDDAVKACEKIVEEVRKEGGNEAARKLARCLRESRGCAEAAGCATGLGLNALSAAALEFLDGIRRAQ